MAANEPNNQNNSSMCPSFTQTTAFSMSRHWSIIVSIICWSRLSWQMQHCVCLGVQFLLAHP